MANELQEWIALGIVVLVAALGLWRYLFKRRGKACSQCASAGCGPRGEPEDRDVRVLARPDVRFVKRPARISGS